MLLLLLMSANVHPNPDFTFPYAVCAGNMTWRGRSVQYCTYSKWIRLRCSQLSFSRFNTLGCFYSWSCTPCCVPASSESLTLTNTVSTSSSFSGLYTPLFTLVHLVPSCQCSAPAQLSSSNLLPSFRSLRISFLCTLSTPSFFWQFSYTSCFFFPPHSIKVFQCDTTDIQARSAKLLHFISSHPVDLVCIQESNRNLSSSCRIPGFSVLQSDRTHS